MISMIKKFLSKSSKQREIKRYVKGGISDEYDIININDLEAVNTYEGTFDIHSLIQGNNGNIQF